MKRFAVVVPVLLLSLAVCLRPASACPIATSAAAVETAAVAALAPPVVEAPVVVSAAPVVVQAAPVLTTIAMPTVSVVAVPTVVEQVVKVKAKAKRQFGLVAERGNGGRELAVVANCDVLEGKIGDGLAVISGGEKHGNFVSRGAESIAVVFCARFFRLGSQAGSGS